MNYKSTIIADSISESGHRLTTIEVTLPRFCLAELNTHRKFSRNSASSRAIPIAKMIERVENNPVIPLEWGSNQPGMQAGEVLTGDNAIAAHRVWLMARDEAVKWAEALELVGVHKQITNRLLEPFLWHTAIVSSTDFENFFEQRCSPMAQPEIRQIAEMMRDSLAASEPTLLREGEWHLPYTTADEKCTITLAQLKQLSVARCARVSFLAHDGTRDFDKDFALYEKLLAGQHFSPFEHVSTPDWDEYTWANFDGWRQERRDVMREVKTT